jgi:hypothetical protein
LGYQYIYMKRLFYLPLIFSILLSCKSKITGDDQDTTTTKPLDQTPELEHLFKPLISGVWVKQDYLKKIKKSKSLVAAADKAEGMTTMAIDTSKMQGDSIMVPVIINNHQGNTVALKFESGRNPNTVVLGNDELSYKIKNTDTTLIVYHYNTETKETMTLKFIKAMQSKPGVQPGDGLNMAVNKSIIAGAYIATDAAGKKYNVSFAPDGEVAGLPGFSTYYVQADLVTNPKDASDQIIFNLNEKGQKPYLFLIHKNTITLYENADQLKLNKPGFTLNRKKR